MKLPFQTDQGMGSKAAFGAIILPADETLENELRMMFPQDGVALYHSRIEMPPSINPETLAGMRLALPEATRMLPESTLDVVGYGCTSGATVIGPVGVADAIHTHHPESKVTDPITATLAACHAIGVKRLAFVTPYVAEVSAAMRQVLEDSGLEIAGFASFEEGDDRVVARITPASILAAIEYAAALEPCDAVFVACTNLRVAGIAPEAERRIGKPVLSSNLVLGWHMMRLAGLTGGLPDLELFRRA